MPVVRTPVDPATYAKLVAARKAAGLPSVSALFLQKCNVLDDRLEAGEIVRRAKTAMNKIADNERFRLRDLFKASVWDQFSKGARLRAGRLFYHEMAAAKDGIRPERKSASGHQFYIKAAAAKRPAA
jgi:Domain of unknown function (DUF1413)